MFLPSGSRTCTFTIYLLHFCFFLCAYCSFSFLILITARRPLKLAMPATSFDIPSTICSLVFYSHINAISSLYSYSRNLIVQILVYQLQKTQSYGDMYCLQSFYEYIIVFYFFIPSCFLLVPLDQRLDPICDMLIT